MTELDLISRKLDALHDQITHLTRLLEAANKPPPPSKTTPTPPALAEVLAEQERYR